LLTSLSAADLHPTNTFPAGYTVRQGRHRHKSGGHPCWDDALPKHNDTLIFVGSSSSEPIQQSANGVIYMRKRIYEVIEISNGSDLWSSIYDYFMMVVILASLLSLTFKQENTVFVIIDKTAVIIFIIDYLLRLCTADFKYANKSITSFIRYPLSMMALIDLFSILPSVSLLNNSFKLLRILRLIRAFRVFRVFKVLRYSKSFRIIVSVFKKQKESLLAVLTLAIAYIIISALIIFNIEPDSFGTFFDAVYWATVSLTTMGYGDIYPVTSIGRIVTMVSAIFGIAIVALPAGIITAGYMHEITSDDK
jgi:voltage-gated potassium channel